MKDARMASISLTLKDPVLGEQFIGLTLLYGADDVPGSLIVLKPGETVQIRARSVWLHSSGPRKRLEPGWVRETEVGAQVLFDFVPDIEPIVRSTNRVAVSVARPDDLTVRPGASDTSTTTVIPVRSGRPATAPATTSAGSSRTAPSSGSVSPNSAEARGSTVATGIDRLRSRSGSAHFPLRQRVTGGCPRQDDLAADGSK
jgi:hypothetical protein